MYKQSRSIRMAPIISIIRKPQPGPVHPPDFHFSVHCHAHVGAHADVRDVCANAHSVKREWNAEIESLMVLCLSVPKSKIIYAPSDYQQQSSHKIS